MAFVPWHKFDRIRKLLEGDSEGEAGSAAYGYGKRSAQRILQSTFEVYKPLGVAGMQGQQISFWGADLERALSFTLMRGDVYRQAFLTACEPHREIKIILYGDECTGGNVLQVASSKKIFFTHFAVHNCLKPTGRDYLASVFVYPGKRSQQREGRVRCRDGDFVARFSETSGQTHHHQWAKL